MWCAGGSLSAQVRRIEASKERLLARNQEALARDKKAKALGEDCVEEKTIQTDSKWELTRPEDRVDRAAGRLEVL